MPSISLFSSFNMPLSPISPLQTHVIIGAFEGQGHDPDAGVDFFQCWLHCGDRIWPLLFLAQRNFAMQQEFLWSAMIVATAIGVSSTALFFLLSRERRPAATMTESGGHPKQHIEKSSMVLPAWVEHATAPLPGGALSRWIYGSMSGDTSAPHKILCRGYVASAGLNCRICWTECQPVL